MGIIEALMAKRQRSGHGVRQAEGIINKINRSFVPGECPHFEVKWAEVRNKRVVAWKGYNDELSDFRPRASVMSVSPRETVGYEKSHINGRCITAERSLPGGHGAERTKDLLKRVSGPSGMGAGGGAKGPRHKTGKPVVKRVRGSQTLAEKSAPNQETRAHLAKGLCGALTKKQTRCQRKAMPESVFCGTHAGASTTAGA